MKSDKWTDLIFENTNDLIFIVEIEANEIYRCISVNPAYLKKTGFSKEQVIGKTPEQVLPPEAASFVLSKYREAISKKEKILYEEQVNLPDGLIMVETTLTPVIGPLGEATHLFGILRDVTERRAQERAHFQNEKALEDIFNLSPVPMVISTILEGTVVMVNESFAENMGYLVNDLIGTKTQDLYPDPAIRRVISQNVWRNGRAKNLELSLKRADGQVAHFLFSAEVITMKGEEMFLSCFFDITERRTIEKALFTSESNLKTVFENTEIGYILLDSELNVLSYNQHASDFSLLEHGKHLQVGDNFFDFFPPERQVGLRATMKKVIQGATVSRERESIRSNGEIHWYDVKYSPVLGKEGNVTGVLMSLEDITERKKSDIERNKSFELISDQNKRLLDFSYIVSHNLRSHTSNIKSILKLVSTAKSESDRMEMMGHLYGVSDALDDTLVNLNNVVSLHSNVKIMTESLDLGLYIEQASKILSDLIAKKKAVIHNHVQMGVKVTFNPAYLESILLNFISNAVRYGHPDRIPEVNIDYTIENSVGKLRIRDNGVGIDMQKHGSKLFGMYKTFHGNKDAKGIGLFITKNHIEAMGGSVEVESTPEVGTIFTVKLPI